MGEKIINDGVDASTRKSQAPFLDYINLMLGKPRIRLNNLKTNLKFPCLCLNPIIDSISLAHGLRQLTRDINSGVSFLKNDLNAP